MKQVRGDLRLRQHPPYRRGVDAAHVDRDGLDPVPPGGSRLASQYAASSAVRPSTWPSRPCPPARSKKQVCHRSTRTKYSPVSSSSVHRGRPRRCSSIPRHLTGAGGCSSTGSARAANASCATGHDTQACRAASAGVIPRSATSVPACSRSRRVSRHRGGTCGTHSLNVLRAQPSASHFQRRFTQCTATWSGPRRASRGRASTYSCTRPAGVGNPGTRPRPGNLARLPLSGLRIL